MQFPSYCYFEIWFSDMYYSFGDINPKNRKNAGFVEKMEPCYQQITRWRSKCRELKTKWTSFSHEQLQNEYETLVAESSQLLKLSLELENERDEYWTKIFNSV